MCACNPIPSAGSIHPEDGESENQIHVTIIGSLGQGDQSDQPTRRREQGTRITTSTIPPNDTHIHDLVLLASSSSAVGSEAQPESLHPNLTGIPAHDPHPVPEYVREYERGTGSPICPTTGIPDEGTGIHDQFLPHAWIEHDPDHAVNTGSLYLFRGPGCL